MISFLHGTIVRKSPTELVIDVNGVGYLVSIPLSTFEQLENSNGIVTILTHLHVREDSMQLYGFASETERELFRSLITVSGIGPKIAQGILSGLDASDLKSAIAGGNISALTSISGVGRKTAERIVIELRDKLLKTDISAAGATPAVKSLKNRSEAVEALMSLGHSRASAEKSVQTVSRESKGEDLSVEELIKRALRHSAQ